MPISIQIPMPVLFGFLLVLARVSGLIVLVPLPGLQATPETARIVLVFAMTFILMPAWPRPDVPSGIALMAGSVCTEFVYGLVTGAVVALLLEAAQLTTQLIGLQAGYSFASTIDPSTQADSSVLQVTVQLLTGSLFFTLGFDRELIGILAGSVFEPGKSHLAGGGVLVRALQDLGSQMFLSGLRMALPLLALLILIDISFAILAKVHAQFQTQSLSFAAKMLLGLVLLGVTLGGYPDEMRGVASRSIGLLGRLVAR